MFEINLSHLPKIEQQVCRELIKRKITITSAESLTCGMFQSALGNVPGISSVFPGGFVTYSNQAKHVLLSIPQRVIDHDGVVSNSVAIWMAKQARKIMKTDLAISFTGVAGPSSLEGQPAGTVWIGISGRKRDGAKLFHLASHLNQHSFNSPVSERNQIRKMVVEIGLQMINDEIK